MDKEQEAFITLICRAQNTLKGSLGKIISQVKFPCNKQLMCKRPTGKSGILYVIKTAKLNKLEGLLYAMDIEKAF